MRLTVTRRDLTVAGVAGAAVAGVFGTVLALAQGTQSLLGSGVYPWSSLVAKTSPVGEARQVIDGPTATLERLEVHITTLNPHTASHPPHTHPNEELILISTGTVETLSKGEWKRLGPGSVVLNGSDDLHGFRNVGDTPAQYFVVNWRTPATDAIAARESKTASVNAGNLAAGARGMLRLE